VCLAIYASPRDALIGIERRRLRAESAEASVADARGIAGSDAVGARAADTHLDVDMARFTSGLVPGAAFRVANAIHATVSVLADGHTARFTPAAGYLGRAGFSFAGTDSEGSTMSHDVGVLVAEALPPG
jgi:hypothetical protein